MDVIGHFAFIFQLFVGQGYQYNFMQYFLLEQKIVLGLWGTERLL
jgi:hypothetical protein